jgi:hypothetical protein
MDLYGRSDDVTVFTIILPIPMSSLARPIPHLPSQRTSIPMDMPRQPGTLMQILRTLVCLQAKTTALARSIVEANTISSPRSIDNVTPTHLLLHVIL